MLTENISEVTNILVLVSFEVDMKRPEQLALLENNILFLHEKMKINKRLGSLLVNNLRSNTKDPIANHVQR